MVLFSTLIGALAVSKPPRKIKVGYLTFTCAELPEHDCEVETGSEYGECDAASLQIIVNRELNSQVKRETVLHEVLHAAIYAATSAQQMTTEQEEKLVWPLSPILLQVLRDNPHLVRFLLEK